MIWMFLYDGKNWEKSEKNNFSIHIRPWAFIAYTKNQDHLYLLIHVTCSFPSSISDSLIFFICLVLFYFVSYFIFIIFSLSILFSCFYFHYLLLSYNSTLYRNYSLFLLTLNCPFDLIIFKRLICKVVRFAKAFDNNRECNSPFSIGRHIS
jgi:hypothetical protein